MLIERDHPRRDTRRFADQDMECHVWFNPDPACEISGFQLAVRGRRLIVWSPAGWECLELREDETTRSLRPAGPFDAASLLILFAGRAAQVDEPIRRFICERLLEAVRAQSTLPTACQW